MTPLLEAGAPPRNRTAYAVLFFVCALGVRCAPPSHPFLDLPEILASSKYIDFSTDVGPSKLCIDDLLAQEDRFIEDVAAYLNTTPPSGRIRHLQQSRSMEGEFGGLPDGPCEGKIGCYTYYKEQDLGVIHTISAAQYHELAHAVDIPAFGPGHRTLIEGLAEYLSSAQSSEAVVADFPERFKAMVAASPMPEDYRMAMHFVGSLLLRDGLAPFLSFHEALPADASLEEFASVFEAVYGDSLEAVLMEMSEPVSGTFIPAGCPGNDSNDMEHIEWSDQDIVDVSLHGACGEPFFTGYGTSIGAGKIFTIDVPRAGFYVLSVDGESPTARPTVELQTCPQLEGYLGNTRSDGTKLLEVLYPGRHQLAVYYPPASATGGTVHLQLKFDSPLL